MQIELSNEELEAVKYCIQKVCDIENEEKKTKFLIPLNGYELETLLIKLKML